MKPGSEIKVFKPKIRNLTLSYGSVSGRKPKREYPLKVALMLSTLKMMGYDFHECDKDHLVEGQTLMISPGYGDIYSLYRVVEVQQDGTNAVLLCLSDKPEEVKPNGS